MKPLLFGLVLLSCVFRLPAAESLVHLDDSGELLPAEAAWLKSCEAKLAEYERTTGIRIIVQFHLQSPTEDEDKQPGAYMHALARKLEVDRHGVLVVYFHDDPDWRVWIGDELTSVFAGKTGTVAELTASGAIHEVKEAMLEGARAKAEAAIAAAQKNAATETTITVAQRLIFQTEALLDALTARLISK